MTDILRMVLGIGIGASVVAPAARAGILDEPNAPRRCTIIVQSWVRPDSGGHVVLRMRADSALAGRFVAHPEAALARRMNGQPIRVEDTLPRPTYGQLADVVARDEPWATGRLPRDVTGVVLMSWELGSACGAVPARDAAHRYPPGTLVVLVTGRAAVAREDERPVLHQSFGSTATAYVPSLVRATQPRAWWRLGRRRPVLSADEYVELLQAMPTWSAWNADPVASTQSLDRWARRHPVLAAREPARATLAEMRRIRAIEPD